MNCSRCGEDIPVDRYIEHAKACVAGEMARLRRRHRSPFDGEAADRVRREFEAAEERRRREGG